MKLLAKENRVQIRVAEVAEVNHQYRLIRGKLKSMTVYDSTTEEVFVIIKQAIENECQKHK